MDSLLMGDFEAWLLPILFGFGMYFVRNLPEIVWNGAKWLFTSKLQVNSEDYIFVKFNHWLSTICSIGLLRSLKVESNYDIYSNKRLDHTSIGVGKHIIRSKYGWMYIKRREESPGAASDVRKETVEIAFLRNSGKLSQIVSDIRNYSPAGIDATMIYTYSDGWLFHCFKPIRTPGSTVFHDDKVGRISGVLDSFMVPIEQSRSDAHHLGFLFYGEPGTGKTTLALVIAGILKRGIAYLSLNGFKSDADFFEAYRTVPDDAVLLIEDIDTFGITRDKDKDGVSLSALLNVLGGVLTRHGQITIVTTNRIEKLDDALIRPGRLSVSEEFLLYDREEAERYCDMVGVSRELIGECSFPMSPAELEFLLGEKGQ
jgi:hypothetical protein